MKGFIPLYKELDVPATDVISVAGFFLYLCHHYDVTKQRIDSNSAT